MAELRPPAGDEAAERGLLLAPTAAEEARAAPAGSCAARGLRGPAALATAAALAAVAGTGGLLIHERGAALGREATALAADEGPSTHPAAGRMFMERRGLGCTNWKAISVGNRSTGETLESCSRRCTAQSGCVGFGFQEKGSCSGEGSGEDGGCLLWGGACATERNACWNLYGPFVARLPDGKREPAYSPPASVSPPNASLPVPFAKQTGIGCKNFDEIAIGGPKFGESLESCADKCNWDPRCVGFGHQAKADCKGVGFGKDNVCFMWSDRCAREENTCWVQYGIVKDAPVIPSTTKPPPPPKPSTTTNLHHQVSLYCWTAIKLGTYEVGLIENQFRRQMGIFNWECNDKALITDGEYSLEADGRKFTAISVGPGAMDCDRGSGGSWSNTGVFKRAWQAVFDQRHFQLYDWILKVDADVVFRPLRFKWHVNGDHMGLNPDERIYFKNFDDGYPVVGAIEVASRAVVEAMAQDPGGCGNIWVPAEDDWFHNCMEYHGARQVEDSDLLQHEGIERCDDQWLVLMHPYKDVESMNRCDNAVR